MRLIFADTNYWVAIIDQRDQHHGMAKLISASLRDIKIISTQEVLGELLTAFSNRGTFWRAQVIMYIQRILQNNTIEIVEQSSMSFVRAFEHYQRRLDKQYSYVDCVAMSTMLDRHITDILTNDHHFEQEGFKVLLKEAA
jgi:uncharacterized protein